MEHDYAEVSPNEIRLSDGTVFNRYGGYFTFQPPNLPLPLDSREAVARGETLWFSDNEPGQHGGQYWLLRKPTIDHRPILIPLQSFPFEVRYIIGAAWSNPPTQQQGLMLDAVRDMLDARQIRLDQLEDQKSCIQVSGWIFAVCSIGLTYPIGNAIYNSDISSGGKIGLGIAIAVAALLLCGLAKYCSSKKNQQITDLVDMGNDAQVTLAQNIANRYHALAHQLQIGNQPLQIQYQQF